MKSKVLKDVQSYRRVVGFGIANPKVIAPAVGDPATWSTLTRQCHTLAIIVDDISKAASQQEVQAASTRLDATDENALRKHLRAELNVVTQIAQTLRKEIPGIGTIKMPPKNLAAERLINSADALTTMAETYQSVFIEHGLAHDFIAQIRAAISALKASIDGRGSARSTRKKATKSLEVNTALGRRYVRLMDALLTKSLRNDPATLAEWKQAKRAVAVASTTATTPEQDALTTPAEVKAA